MLRNYLQTGLRILLRNKAISIINIVGFAVGLATVLVIFLYIRHETSFDKHLSNKDRLYRIIRKYPTASATSNYTSFPVPFSQALQDELDSSHQVVKVFFSTPRPVQANQNSYFEDGIILVEPVFLHAFDVQMVEGHPDKLDQPNTVFLSKTQAGKYFGDQNPMGKEIVVGGILHLSVVGIFKDPPKNTHIPYKLLVSFKSLNPEFVGIDYDTWDLILSQSKCYLLLGENESKTKLENTIKEIYEKYRPAENYQRLIELLPITDIHLDTRFEIQSCDYTYTTSKQILWIYSSVAILVLGIVLINFINISIVQALTRTKEIAMRKVVGASRKKLIGQLFMETTLVVLAGEIFAIILVETFLPLINHQLGPMIRLNLYGSWETIAFLLFMLILVCLLAGILPSIYLSKFRPIEVMRKNFQIRKHKKSVPGYKLLVITEFLITQVLLIIVIVIQAQVSYMQKKDLGFESENIVWLLLPRADTTGKMAFKNELLQHQNISSVSLTFGLPTDPSSAWFWGFSLQENPEKYASRVKFTDLDYLQTFNIQLVAGRWFHPSIQNQQICDQVVVNEQFVKKFGFSHADSVIGKWIRLTKYKTLVQIIGVTKDFHHESLRENLTSLMLYYYPSAFHKASVRLEKPYYRETLEYMKECYAKHMPGQAFIYRIYEEDMKQIYAEEKRNYNLLNIFAIIAVILSIMGLYGLVSFMMVQKTREIGIRKANGATSGGITRMYIFRYLKIIFLASILAWPVAYYFMSRWLRGYAYHIELTIGYFIAGLLIIILIALLTILLKTMKTANTNPAETLRDE